MPRFPYRNRLILIVVSILVLVGFVKGAPGQENNLARGEKEIGVVLRVQRELVEKLMSDEIEMSLPVNETVDGIPIWGSVAGVAKPIVVWETSETISTFTLTLDGFADANVQVDAGPAVASAFSRTTFHIGKRITFDGRNFAGDQAQIGTATNAGIGAVCPKRRGLVGRMISVVGGRMARRAIPEINVGIDDAAQQMLTEYFDQATGEMLEELNKSHAFEATAAYFQPRDEQWEFKTATEKDFMVAGAGPRNAVLPKLPRAAGNAPVELWLRTRPAEDLFIRLTAEWEGVHDMIAQFLDPESGEEFEDDIEIATINGWTVIRAGMSEVSAGGE